MWIRYFTINLTFSLVIQLVFQIKKYLKAQCLLQALCFYNLSGASIDPATLKHVAKVCANVDLSDHVVEVIFTIFDEDGDGQLSNKVRHNYDCLHFCKYSDNIPIIIN